MASGWSVGLATKAQACGMQSYMKRLLTWRARRRCMPSTSPQTRLGLPWRPTHRYQDRHSRNMANHSAFVVERRSTNFTVSNDKNIRSFALSTGSQLAESPILNNNHSISLAGNGRFISTVADHAISFLESSTLASIGTSIEDSERVWSIAISMDSSQIATG